MAALDDFGEVYTVGGQLGGEEEAFFNTAQMHVDADANGDGVVGVGGVSEAESALTGNVGATENEDDIYGFSENGQAARGDDEEEEDEVNIVLDTENLDKSGPYGRGAGRGFRNSGNISTSNFSAITPGGRYSIGRNATTAAPLKPSQQQQKSIFELDIDSMEEKPWRKPGVDSTDYFNYGFNEDSWRQYCEKQSQMRLEQSMQSKIKVYESSRGDKDGGKQELPPEIQAMVDGDKRKRTSNSSRRPGAPVQEDWPSRDRGFEHRRRPRDLDPAVVHITTGGEEDENMPAEGMEEFYIPTSGGYPPARGGFVPDYSSSSSRDDRRRDDDRKRDRDRRDDRRERRTPSRSPSRRSDDRDKDKERGSERSERRERDKDKDRSDRRDRDKRKDDRESRDDRDKEKDRDDRDDHKRKSSSSSSRSQEDDERAKRRR